MQIAEGEPPAHAHRRRHVLHGPGAGPSGRLPRVDPAMYAGDEYVYGEEDDEQDSAVCSPSVNPSVNASQCELSAAFASGARPQSDKARECPGRKRRIVKVTQWSASARANMIKALRERVT